MKILYFNNGSGLGTSKSGGVTRHIETTKGMKNKGVKVYIVTTEGCYTLYKREKLHVERFFVVRAHIFKKREKTKWDRVFSYLVSTVHSLLLVPHLPKTDIVYAPSDYFCDVIPAIIYRILHKNTQMVNMIHHICKSPFKRRGNFFINTTSYIFQRISFLLISKTSDRVLVYATPEGKRIAQYLENLGAKKGKIFYVSNGIDYKKIVKITQNDKIYDACFAGGLRVTKGVFDLIPIWKNVCDHKKDARLVVAGEGTLDTTEKLKNLIIENDLQKNILLTGALDSVTLYKTMKESKIFISASHEEGWGIAVCEALACGLPTVVFDLPAFVYLENKIIRVKKFNYAKFSQEILNLLESAESREMRGKAGQNFVKRFDWKTIAEDEYIFLKMVLD